MKEIICGQRELPLSLLSPPSTYSIISFGVVLDDNDRLPGRNPQRPLANDRWKCLQLIKIIYLFFPSNLVKVLQNDL